MTNVSRPKQLQLQRPSSEIKPQHQQQQYHHQHHAMVSSASGPGPFGENVAGFSAFSPVASPAGGMGDSGPRGPPSTRARAPVIRPTALINLNNCAQPPSSLTLTLASPSMTTPRSPQPSATRCARLPPAQSPGTTSTQPKALSPSDLNDSLPSLIMPNLYVGNQEQTNRETVNKLNIKYILSLGLLPMISANATSSVANTCLVSPLPPVKSSSSSSSSSGGGVTNGPESSGSAAAPILMPSRNSSRDFKFRIKSNTSSASPTRQPAGAAAVDSPLPHHHHHHHHHHQPPRSPLTNSSATTTTNTGPSAIRKMRDENEGVKQVRSVYCKCINIADNSESSLSKFFDEAFAFIEEARRKKCNILIHCLAGISRSPTVAIAYLMRLRSLHWKDAYDFVKQCRPQIDPNLNFMGQLRIYNRSLRDSRQRNSMTTIGSCKRASNGPLLLTGADDQTSCGAIKSSKTSCCSQGSNSKSLTATSPLTPPAVATTATSLGDL